MKGWTEASFDDSNWKTPEIVKPRDNEATATAKENAINPRIVAKRDRPIQPVKNGIDNPNGSAKTDETGRDTAIRAIESRNTPEGTAAGQVDVYKRQGKGR